MNKLSKWSKRKQAAQSLKNEGLEDANKKAKTASLVGQVGSLTGTAASAIPVVGPILGPAIAGITGAVSGGLGLAAKSKAKKATKPTATDVSLKVGKIGDPEEEEDA